MAVHFTGVESTFSYFEATRAYLGSHGKPLAFYSDKASVFRVNPETAGGPGFTQFARALYELNIDGICANTPAAKGRVERAHLTLQDRLVKELRLAGISLRANVMWNTCLGQFRVQVGHAHDLIVEQFFEWIHWFLLRGPLGGSP
jgi:hypothetical protein